MYSYEDVFSQEGQLEETPEFATKHINSESITKHLQEKKYEEGWIADHDQYASQNFRESLKLDLKKAQRSSYNPDRNLLADIIEFNQVLFQQISQKKDVELDPLKEHQKNYLLVPLTLIPGTEE